MRITLPDTMGDGGVRTPNFVGYSARDSMILGTIQGRQLAQYDLTNEQYDSLIKLTAALCTIFPNLPCDYPRDDEGNLVTTNLPPDQLASFRGLIGHYHIQHNKIDPGPAFDWERVVSGASREIRTTPKRQSRK
jgi:N-acetylmuramoyl-L-alanine amidase